MKHLLAVRALRRLIASYQINAPRYDHMAGYVETRIAEIEAAIKVLESDDKFPEAQDGVPLRDLPKWTGKKDEERERLALERLELHRQEILNWY